MKQITEDYCNKEVSALLKEKGFDVPVKNYFSLNKDAILHNLDKKYGAKKNWNAFDICISRPSQSLALKWLREVHNIHIDVFIGSDESCDMDGVTIDEWHFWTYYITNTSGDMIYDAYNKVDVIEHQTYEEAVEAACLWVLKNLL